MLLGTLQVLSDEAGPGDAWAGVAIEALIVPVDRRRRVSRSHQARAVRAVARARARRDIRRRRSDACARSQDPPVDRCAVRRRTGRRSPHDAVVAFLAFTGVAAMVPGGLVQARTGETLATPYLIALVTGDAIVATMLGYRVAALWVISARMRCWLALTYGAAIAIAAAAIRATADPAARRPGAVDPRVLPVGRVHRVCAGTLARPTLGGAARRAGRARDRGRGLEPPPPRVTASR